MASTPSVSVAIATYQGERFLRQQLDSIARQTVLPLEVVITDDQSSDATVAIAEEFGRSVPFPVRVYRNEARLGYGGNFFRAASLCEGEVIAFCDQDDVWLEHKLKTCLKYLKDPGVQLVMHSAQTISAGGQLGYFYPHFKKTRVLRVGQCNPLVNEPGFCMVFRRALLSYLPMDIRPERLFAHDSLALFAGAVLGKVVKLKTVLAHYRQHENNVFGAHNHTLGWQMRIATETPKYQDVANAEADCSRYLFASLDRIESRWKKPARAWAKRLAFRSKLHAQRHDLYSGRLGAASRAKIYARILLSGGYFPDRAKNRLGPKAALKDLVMGVAGWRKG